MIEEQQHGDHALVLDFGIAKLLDDKGENLTGKFAIGTPPYMSPEQLVGSKLTTKSVRIQCNRLF